MNDVIMSFDVGTTSIRWVPLDFGLGLLRWWAFSFSVQDRRVNRTV